MIDINLLPPEYGPKKAINLVNIIIILLSTLICLSLLLASMRLLNSVQDYNTRLDYHENQVKYFRRQVEDIHELARKVKLLKVRLSLVEELLHEQATWSDKLIEISDCMPSYGVWIDTLAIEHGDGRRRANVTQVTTGPVTAYISGGCVSIDKISQFVGRLETSEVFGAITFESAESYMTDGEPFVSFKLAVELPGLGT